MCILTTTLYNFHFFERISSKNLVVSLFFVFYTIIPRRIKKMGYLYPISV